MSAQQFCQQFRDLGHSKSNQKTLKIRRCLRVDHKMPVAMTKVILEYADEKYSHPDEVVENRLDLVDRYSIEFGVKSKTVSICSWVVCGLEVIIAILLLLGAAEPGLWPLNAFVSLILSFILVGLFFFQLFVAVVLWVRASRWVSTQHVYRMDHFREFPEGIPWCWHYFYSWTRYMYLFEDWSNPKLFLQIYMLIIATRDYFVAMCLSLAVLLLMLRHHQIIDTSVPICLIPAWFALEYWYYVFDCELWLRFSPPLMKRLIIEFPLFVSIFLFAVLTLLKVEGNIDISFTTVTIPLWIHIILWYSALVAFFFKGWTASRNVTYDGLVFSGLLKRHYSSGKFRSAFNTKFSESKVVLVSLVVSAIAISSASVFVSQGHFLKAVISLIVWFLNYCVYRHLTLDNMIMYMIGVWFQGWRAEHYYAEEFLRLQTGFFPAEGPECNITLLCCLCCVRSWITGPPPEARSSPEAQNFVVPVRLRESASTNSALSSAGITYDDV